MNSRAVLPVTPERDYNGLLADETDKRGCPADYPAKQDRTSSRESVAASSIVA
jgi:hypothetical protein